MVNFNFENFNNTSEIIKATRSLDKLAAELNHSRYDYSVQKEHTFEVDNLMVQICAENGILQSVTVSNVINKEEEAIN